MCGLPSCWQWPDCGYCPISVYVNTGRDRSAHLLIISGDFTVQRKLIVLENLTPVLSPEEKKKRKREIENNLYDIFSKYGDRFR